MHCFFSRSGLLFLVILVEVYVVVSSVQPSFAFLDQNGKNLARGISLSQGEATIGGIDAFSAHADDETILIFGGLSYNANSGPGSVNDVWRFEISPNRWTWVTGAQAITPYGSYYSAPKSPAGRQYMASWLLSNGDLIVFGGYAITGPTSYGGFNDLWRYRPSVNEWDFIGGTTEASHSGRYGTKGTASTENIPRARFISASWKSSNGDLWLFGGVGFSAYLNDLWRYRPSTNEWTWVSGSDQHDQLGTYSSQGQISVNDMPGARAGHASWVDANGNLWMFGGYGFTTGSSGYLNDLWRYNPSTNIWTWMKGSKNVNEPGHYGTQNVSSPLNTPGGRGGAGAASDPNNDDLWLFGGEGGYFNDLWRYRISTNEWTWISGSNAINAEGVYGTRGAPSTSNIPGARSGKIVTDSNSDIWLIGGVSQYNGLFNDVWRYRPSTNEWTWMNGNDVVNSFAVYSQCTGIDDDCSTQPVTEPFTEQPAVPYEPPVVESPVQQPSTSTTPASAPTYLTPTFTNAPVEPPVTEWRQQITSTVSIRLKVGPSFVVINTLTNDLEVLLNLPSNAIPSVNVDIDRSTSQTTVVVFVIYNVQRADGSIVDPIATSLELRRLIDLHDPRIAESNLLRGMEFINNDEPPATSQSNLVSIACGMLQLSLFALFV